MSIVFIAIGTNLGNRTDNLSNAIKRLSEVGIFPVKQSRVYETAPMYVEDQPRFLNMVVMAETELDCNAILKALKFLESDIGRVKTMRNGPRLIDLDILYLNDEIVNNNNLQIPHIHIAERQFVLQPLLDLNPDLHDVRTNKTIKQMADELAEEPTLSVMWDTLPD